MTSLGGFVLLDKVMVFRALGHSQVDGAPVLLPAGPWSWHEGSHSLLGISRTSRSADPVHNPIMNLLAILLPLGALLCAVTLK